MNLPGGPTKEEIIAIALSKLCLRKGDTFADIGCGTGSVAIAVAGRVGQVYAVDRRPDAIAVASDVISKAGARNIALIEGEAVDFLAKAPKLDAAFVGGSHRLEEVITLLARNVTGRVVVTAVRLGTLHDAVRIMQELGIFIEAVHVQVSRTSVIGGDLMFKPINPVYIIVGGRREC